MYSFRIYSVTNYILGMNLQEVGAQATCALAAFKPEYLDTRCISNYALWLHSVHSAQQATDEGHKGSQETGVLQLHS